MEQAGLGVELSDGSTIGGVSNSEEDVVHAKWRLRANVSICAVVVFAKELVEGCWN